MSERELTGKVASERIRRYEAPRPADGSIDRFEALGDAGRIVSDIMDELGITGVRAASRTSFVPVARARKIQDLAARKRAAEERKCELFEGSVPVADLPSNARRWRR